jgi:hypothetical protein
MKLWLVDDDEMVDWVGADVPQRFYLPRPQPLSYLPTEDITSASSLRVHVYERERTVLDPVAPVVRYRLIGCTG